MLSTWKACCSGVSQRWVFIVMSSIGIWLGNALRVVLSIVITDMVVTAREDVLHKDDTCTGGVETLAAKNSTVRRTSGGVYDWDEYTQGLVLSAYFWGYAVTQFPLGWLAERYGGKHVMGLSIFVPALMTALTPWSIAWGEANALIVVRAIMGLASGGLYPVANTLISQWSLLAERTKCGTIVFAAGILGTVFGTTAPAVIIGYYGWPAVFYSFGTVGVLWYPLWLMLCYSFPKDHPFISEAELKVLQNDTNRPNSKKGRTAPWGRIFRSMPVWAFVAAMVGSDWAYFTMVADLPKYMSSVVKFSIEDNGYISSLPYLSEWVMSFVSSWILDALVKHKWMSLTTARKSFATVAITGPAIFILAASYAECDRLLVVIMFVMGMTLMALVFPSVVVNAMDLSPNYSGSLMAFGNGAAALGGVLAPYVVGVLTPNQTIAEWRLVFWIVFAVSVSANVIFVLYATTEAQEWNDPNFRSNLNKSNEANEKRPEEDCKKVIEESTRV